MSHKGNPSFLKQDGTLNFCLLVGISDDRNENIQHDHNSDQGENDKENGQACCFSVVAEIEAANHDRVDTEVGSSRGRRAKVFDRTGQLASAIQLPTVPVLPVIFG